MVSAKKFEPCAICERAVDLDALLPASETRCLAAGVRRGAFCEPALPLVLL